MIQRAAIKDIQTLLKVFPAVGIIGPRQVGKTTIVRQQLLQDKDHEDVYLDLENPRDRAQLSDPMDYFERRADKRIVLDEIQLMPELFSILRPIIDADRRPGRFILLGSASPQLIRGASESLAGRIGYVELTPITIRELSEEDILLKNHWLRGGYPNSLIQAESAYSEIWRTNYLESYVTRELPLLGSVGQPAVIRNLVKMLAGQQGELLNYSSLARALGVSQATVRGYVDLLEQSFLIHLLRPYFVNVKKRLVKAPKVYIRDSGLLHSLLQIEDEDQLASSIAVGGSWEGYAIEQIISVVSARNQAYFYRTHAGAEIDLVLVGKRGRIVCIEVKRGSTPKLTRGFHSAREDIGPELSLVVAPVGAPYSMGGGIEVVPLEQALDLLMDW